MSEMPSNNETAKIASFGNTKKPKLSEKHACDKFLDNSQFNPKNCIKGTSHDQEDQKGYYTKKFERMLEKSDISKNLELLSDENIVNNSDKNSSFGPNGAGNRITNIFTEKLSQHAPKNNEQWKQSSDSEALKFYNCNTEKSSAFSTQTKKLPNEISDKINIVTDYESSEITDPVTENSEDQTDLEEEYDIFQAGSSSAATTTDTSHFMSNAQDMKSGDGLILKEVKKNKNISNLKNMKTAQAKNNDFKLLVKEFRADNYPSNDILSALTGEYLHTGITQKSMFEYLRKKEIPGTVTQLKKDISAFFTDAAEAGIIKSRNRRFYLNNAGDAAIGNTQQSPKHKLPEENDDFEKSDDVAKRNTPQKRKFVNENNDLESHNCTGTNIVKRQNVGDNIGSSSPTIFELGPSTSNRETKNDEEGEMEPRENAENEEGDAEHSYITKMSVPVENDVQSVSESVMNDLPKQIVKAKRKRSKEVQEQDNKIKMTILNMIKSARSRRTSVK